MLLSFAAQQRNCETFWRCSKSIFHVRLRYIPNVWLGLNESAGIDIPYHRVLLIKHGHRAVAPLAERLSSPFTLLNLRGVPVRWLPKAAPWWSCRWHSTSGKRFP